MKRSMVGVLIRLGLAFASTVAVFWLLINPWRNVEAKVLAFMFGAIGVQNASEAFGHQILVLPEHAAPFLATISPSCSARRSSSSTSCRRACSTRTSAA